MLLRGDLGKLPRFPELLTWSLPPLHTQFTANKKQIILRTKQSYNGCSTLCRETRLLWPHDHPICALDSCGVPCNETVVWNFVKSFQRRPYRAKAEDYRATIGQAPDSASKPPETLSYVEFSLMMLALARQQYLLAVEYPLCYY
ncbi:hypothetical protein TraAM80_08012 [Trypanosoma rangeli]|uniref:Uncharacterized protein n=1 Tax=Trypanosoma rangeli TaxID=5698 RepID=A0A422N2N2_TRYRA|nr:uncharacterized protein TraAM80_08012 [Trypanosoma rangeli]RNE99724.1 hypothetical protein TraAM80_08012 [Trypanosoma rangeli]|eukprot:RNE99724.1 hypothetical protein TraAM80_08012 [Trypanosoma rangeli]